MQHDTLTNFIQALEQGTRLHISVVFLHSYGNERTRNLYSQQIHTCPVCDTAKSTPEGFAGCFRCRSTVLRMSVSRKRPFGGLCQKGVYEYCYPVIRDSTVAAVVLVGNILNRSPEQLRRLGKHFPEALLQTMQPDYSLEDCEKIAQLVASYIHYLLDQYGQTSHQPANALVENIKSYIEENFLYDFSAADLAAVFNYNEKYLGRLFLKHTGSTVTQYRNHRRLAKAKALLKQSRQNVADIATQTGYNNVTYFNRIFKKAFGCTPVEYRKKHHIPLEK